MFLSPVIGWGRLSLVTNRLPDARKVSEIVEIISPDSSTPNNTATFNNVVLRKREVCEIMCPDIVL